MPNKIVISHWFIIIVSVKSFEPFQRLGLTAHIMHMTPWHHTNQPPKDHVHCHISNRSYINFLTLSHCVKVAIIGVNPLNHSEGGVFFPAISDRKKEQTRPINRLGIIIIHLFQHYVYFTPFNMTIIHRYGAMAACRYIRRMQHHPNSWPFRMAPCFQKRALLFYVI